jgi:hypothetical protein
MPSNSQASAVLSQTRVRPDPGMGVTESIQASSRSKVATAGGHRIRCRLITTGSSGFAASGAWTGPASSSRTVLSCRASTSHSTHCSCRRLPSRTVVVIGLSGDSENWSGDQKRLSLDTYEDVELWLARQLELSRG